MDLSILRGRASEGDIAHETKKGSIARARQGIKSKDNMINKSKNIETKTTNPTLRECVLNRIAAPNPTQITTTGECL